MNLAAANPNRKVVFFAIGFETTAPPNAMAVWMASKRKLKNFSVLVSHVTVPMAMTAILGAPGNRVQGFLGPGHVCTVVGYEEYEPIAHDYHVPIVITGFEPVDMLEGILMTVRQLEAGEATVQESVRERLRCVGKRITQGRAGLSTTSSKYVTANGAASARSRKADIGSARNIAITTPSCLFESRAISRRRNRMGRSASAAKFFAEE